MPSWAPSHLVEFYETLVGGLGIHSAGQGSGSSVPDGRLVLVAVGYFRGSQELEYNHEEADGFLEFRLHGFGCASWASLPGLCHTREEGLCHTIYLQNQRGLQAGFEVLLYLFVSAPSGGVGHPTYPRSRDV